MSIIYEALQKIEKTPVPKEKNQTKIKMISLTVIGVTFCIGYLYFLYNAGGSYLNKKEPSPKQEISSSQRENKNSSGQYKLAGIIYEESKPIAVINGKTISQGEKIGKAIVKTINKNNVELSIENKTIILNLE